MFKAILTATTASLLFAASADAGQCPSARRRIITYPQRSTYYVAPRVRNYTVARPVRSLTQARPQYEFGACAQLPQLSAGLYEQANAICWEMHRLYRHNAGFEATYATMYTILQDAKHVQDLVAASQQAPRAGDNDHIATDLHHMDGLFHQVADNVELWRPRYYRGGSIRLLALNQQFEDTLHNLMIDYGVHSRLGAEAPAPAVGILRDAPIPRSGNGLQGTVPGPALPLPGQPGLGTNPGLGVPQPGSTFDQSPLGTFRSGGVPRSRR